MKKLIIVLLCLMSANSFSQSKYLKLEKGDSGAVDMYYPLTWMYLWNEDGSNQYIRVSPGIFNEGGENYFYGIYVEFDSTLLKRSEGFNLITEDGLAVLVESKRSKEINSKYFGIYVPYAPDSFLDFLSESNVIKIFYSGKMFLAQNHKDYFQTIIKELKVKPKYIELTNVNDRPKALDINDYFDFYPAEDTAVLIGKSKVEMVCWDTLKPKDYISIKPIIYYKNDDYFLQGLDVKFVGVKEESSLLFELEETMVLFKESKIKSTEENHKFYIVNGSDTAALWLFFDKTLNVQTPSTYLKPWRKFDESLFPDIMQIMGAISFDWLTEPGKVAPEAQDVSNIRVPDEKGHTQLFQKNLCSSVSNIIDSSDKWEGLGYQKGIKETWKIELTKKSKGTYYVNYPDIPCSGEWTIVSKSQNKIVLKEEIKTGKNNCVLATNVVITRVDDENLSVTFFLPDNSKEPYAIGTLKK